MSTCCFNHGPRYNSIFLNLAAWNFLENADQMPLASFEQESGSGNVNFHSVLVLQVASTTEGAFYEGFVSVETEQILAEQLLV